MGTTTTTTTTSTQSGTQLVVSDKSTSYNLGTYVSNIEVQPYIQSTLISFVAYNMRPGCQLHAFFNNKNVDQYCAPGIINTNGDKSTADYVIPTGPWGTQLTSDSSGICIGQFCVPAQTFLTGTLTFELADVSDLSLGASAITTKSAAQFNSTNLTVTNQGITLTTVNPELSFVPVTNTITSSCTSVSNNQAVVQNVVYNNTYVYVTNVVVNTVYGPNTTTYVYGPNGNTGGDNLTYVIDQVQLDPIAQGFMIDTGTNDSGVFLTQLDLFFAGKSSIISHGVTVYICETNAGLPDTSRILPFSRVHLSDSQINVSADASLATSFVFDAPVFVNNQTEYAFVVKPDASDTEVRVYSANVGDLDILTSTQVFSAPQAGVSFISADGLTWTPLQTEYIKYTFYRADFTTSAGLAVFNNDDIEWLKVDSLTYTPLPGDVVYPATNSTSSTANASASGTILYYNPSEQVIGVKNLAGSFDNVSWLQFYRYANAAASNSPTANSMVGYSTANGYYEIRTNALDPRFAAIAPAGTGLTYGYYGASNAYAIDASPATVHLDSTTELLDYERLVLSKSEEAIKTSGAKSANVTVTLTSDSRYLSPVIDLVRSDALVIGNEIDDPSVFLYDEAFSYGPAKSKYISQPITLAAGQDSEDIKIFIDAYRPKGSDIGVYCRFLNSSDPEPLSTKTWTPLTCLSQNNYSDYTNPNDFVQLQYGLGSAYSSIVFSNASIAVSNSSGIITGANTNFTKFFAPGRFVLNQGKIKKVISVANDTYMTVDSAFPNTATNTAIALVMPPTTAYMAPAIRSQLTGTIDISSTNNAVIGTNTIFTQQLKNGDVIDAANDSFRVVSVANDTYLTIETPWSSTATAQTYYLVQDSGLTYQSDTGAVYNSYISFQVKLILTSNNSSRVPRLDDVRAIALS